MCAHRCHDGGSFHIRLTSHHESQVFFYLSLRNGFLFTNFLIVLGHAICLVKIGPMILIGRLIFGISIGILFAIVPLYINEFTPLKLKKFGTLNQVFLASAQSFTFFLYYLLTEPFGMTDKSAYNYVSNFCLITIFIQSAVFLFIFPYETPKYWLEQRQP
jgi:MFS family permease